MKGATSASHLGPPPLSSWFVAVPAATFCVLSFGAIGLVSGALKHARIDGTIAMLLAPAVLGVLAAPGYLYAFASQSKWARASPAVKAWVYISLVGAAAASLGAAIASIPTGIGPVLSIWCFTLVAIAAVRFRRETRHGYTPTR
jgi:hypothetical protein